MTTKLIILGSARKKGSTHTIVNYLIEKGGYDVIDLLDYQIGYFDYEHNNRADDFLPLMRAILPKYNTFIFATPVYWYTMSALMKNFFDRLSDLLKIEKELGRSLRGKSMAMISCSGSDDRNAHFAEPFELSADYLGVKYLGDVHTFLEEGEAIPEEVKRRLDWFVELLSS
jgi:multimeric flavodoxin WrbA